MNLIVAVDENWAIGCRGNLLVRIPADHKMFRQETLGKVVVLGRKTMDTFPGGLPLAGRRKSCMSRRRWRKPSGVCPTRRTASCLRL